MKLLRRSSVWEPLPVRSFAATAHALSTGPEWEYAAMIDRMRRPSASTRVAHSTQSWLLWDSSGFVFSRFREPLPTVPPRPAPAPRSIMGLESDVDYCCRLLGCMSSERVPYLLMRRSPAAISAPVPAELRVTQLGPQDHAAVLPLEAAYQREEVLLPGHLLHNQTVSRHLERSLQQHVGIGVWYKGELIAKAHTNARGITCCQIGGVYTVPAYRGRGCAELALRTLLKTLQARRTTISLFVKPHNTPGRRLYSRLGFETVGRFAIAYV
ncbi:GNAT family N-acetyltransferase [Spirochaeta africana]|uniref:Putative acyltransferase n=1 Tax=Spirochaeta africana (strain ATCC 700263 / DSM 8902 / Z-7692) TaxID=889378 RepID=H9UH92_SPIAZ|nr:GNAT family N-acetyltransferase [Spirochaeta africana]AFG36885.1 putative acyltransferase [Spirochaeta africana DSM 8902]